MIDWQWVAIRAAIMFVCGFAAWFVYLSRNRNVRKHPEKERWKTK